jgi:hypothetical protein
MSQMVALLVERAVEAARKSGDIPKDEGKS